MPLLSASSGAGIKRKRSLQLKKTNLFESMCIANIGAAPVYGGGG